MGKKFNFGFIPFTTDQIKEMSSSELSFNIANFRRMIREAPTSGQDSRPFETEFCYLDHETQKRERAEARQHAKQNYFRRT